MIAMCGIEKHIQVHKDALIDFMKDFDVCINVGEKEGDYYKVDLLIPEQPKPVDWEIKEELEIK